MTSYELAITIWQLGVVHRALCRHFGDLEPDLEAVATVSIWRDLGYWYVLSIN